MPIAPSPAPSPVQTRIESRWLADRLIQIAVTGEIDFATAAELQASLLSTISTELPQRVEVDLAGVTFLDCRGLGVLVAARKAAADLGCRLRITRPQPFVRRVLEITGLLGVLTSERDHERSKPARPT